MVYMGRNLISETTEGIWIVIWTKPCKPRATISHAHGHGHVQSPDRGTTIMVQDCDVKARKLEIHTWPFGECEFATSLPKENTPNSIDDSTRRRQSLSYGGLAESTRSGALVIHVWQRKA